MFQNIRQDWLAHDCVWSRHGFWVLVVYRFGRWRYGFKSRLVRAPLSFLYKLLKFVSEMLLGVELPCEAVIGKRLVIEHVGGIVISGDAVFGDDCILRNGVTVGLRNRNHRGSPTLGNRVDIGAGAKLLGPIHIGDDVAIGANAVVLCDVPRKLDRGRHPCCHQDAQAGRSMTLISIVIIGRNEGARLERCLRSVNAMTLEGFTTEVMYVDSGSTDDSLALAQRLGARTIPLNSPRPTAALGRNAGWRAAAGDFVLFLDGDTILHQDFVRLALPQFSAQTAVVWGHRRELHPKATLYNRVLDLDWVYAPGLTEFCGGDALFRLPVLHQVNGFDETLIAGEEPELCRRVLAVGGEILHVDLPMTLHDLAITHFAQYWKRATRAGHAFAEVSTRFAATTNPFWLADARRNRNRALTLVALPLFALVLTAVLRSPWPVLIALALLAALAARTALKANWKSHDKLALVLYGIHSHFQQIPIYVGQLQFHRSRRTGKRTALVEYKS